jgi:hypothetical protein
MLDDSLAYDTSKRCTVVFAPWRLTDDWHTLSPNRCSVTVLMDTWRRQVELPENIRADGTRANANVNAPI